MCWCTCSILFHWNQNVAVPTPWLFHTFSTSWPFRLHQTPPDVTSQPRWSCFVQVRRNAQVCEFLLSYKVDWSFTVSFFGLNSGFNMVQHGSTVSSSCDFEMTWMDSSWGGQRWCLEQERLDPSPRGIPGRAHSRVQGLHPMRVITMNFLHTVVLICFDRLLSTVLIQKIQCFLSRFIPFALLTTYHNILQPYKQIYNNHW